MIGFAGGAFHGGQLPSGGTTVSHLRPDQGTDAQRTRPLGTPAGGVAELALASLRSQVEAGASAVQLFDSWRARTPDDYQRHVLPASQRVLAGLDDLNVPRIHFGVGTGELLGLMAQAGAEVVGVDWRVPLDVARARIGPGTGVQGNSTPPPASARGTRSRAEPEPCWNERERTPATSSTWVTACCPRPTPTC